MPVETPRQRRVATEPVGVRHVPEVEPEPSVRRVCLPKAFRPAKVGQTRVHTHACACRDEECLRTRDDLTGSLDWIVLIDVLYWHCNDLVKYWSSCWTGFAFTLV